MGTEGRSFNGAEQRGRGGLHRFAQVHPVASGCTASIVLQASSPHLTRSALHHPLYQGVKLTRRRRGQLYAGFAIGVSGFFA